MTPKERIMRALNLEKPDRLPVTTMDMMEYWLNTEMGGRRKVEAYKELGLDAFYFAPYSPFWPYDPVLSSPQWLVSINSGKRLNEETIEYSIKTPKGALSLVQRRNEFTTWNYKNLIQNDEDIYLLKYLPLIPLDKKMYSKMYDEVGDAGILRAGGYGFQEGCWQDACEMYGTEKMIMSTFDKPDWVHEFLNILLDFKLKFIEENMEGLKIDLILNGGGAGSNTVISPDLHKKFCLPYDKKINQAIKNKGIKVVYHTCGGMMGILDSILENGCDASETLTPENFGGDIKDPNKVREKFGGKIAMIGGFDQISILQGSYENIRNEVFRLFGSFGKNGGYIMMTCDHFFHCSKDKLIAYANAAKECAY